jgi:adenosylhomocysteinase
VAYHLENTQLRVLRKYVRQPRHKAALADSRLIILEHILPTTEELLRHLHEAGAEIYSVFAKPYSIDKSVLKRLTAKGVRVLQKTYDELDNTKFLDSHLQSAVSKSKRDGKRIAIIEVGGYFAAPLSRLPKQSVAHIAGVIEDTTFGHNRYLALASKIKVPIFSVARSELKEIEARFVGRDAVAAVDLLLRKLGVSLPGRNALMIGYGMIGTNVARTLRTYDLNVYVYDKQDHRNLRAFSDGFHIHKKRELLKSADIIFCATGEPAVSFEEIEECKNNVILASVGSRDSEFDITTVKQQAVKSHVLGEGIMKYTLPHSRAVMVVRNGTAVNFALNSLPTEVIDLVFSEIILCLMRLLKKQGRPRIGVVHPLLSAELDAIARDWLRFVNV